MKIYIAGKITGDTRYKTKFLLAARQLLAEHPRAVILNPASAPAGLTSETYMRLAFAQIDAADFVVFLPDWPDSRGATLEHSYCEYTGKEHRLLTQRGAPGWAKEEPVDI